MEFNLTSILLHGLMLLLAPPLFLGVIARTKAIFAGRKGPKLLQPYYDLIRCMRKSVVRSTTSSLILGVAPPLIVAATFFAGLFIPLWGTAPVHFGGDVILFAYLLALGRFFTILAAMDVGSSFEGMGASREATFGALSELAFFLGLVVLAVVTQSTSLAGIFEWERGQRLFQPAVIFLFGAFFLLLLTENSRMPVDDPATHLELTMIHEVMVLDYSGPELGLVLYGAAMKLFIFMVLTVSLLWPSMGGPLPLAIGALLIKVTGMAIGIGAIESITARIRLIKIPQILVANFVLVVFALLIVLLD